MSIFDSTIINMEGAKRLSPKRRAKYENDQIFRMFFTDFKNTALHRYKFNNLPPTVSERVLKESLLYYGTAIFFEMNGHILQLPGRPAFDPTMYGEYRYSYIYGANGFNACVALEVPGGEEAAVLNKGIGDTRQKAEYRGAMIRENYDYTNPFIFTVWNYATRVSDAVRSLDVAVRNGKKPGIWFCKDQTMLKSIQRFNEQMDNNEETIVTSGLFPINDVKYQPLSQEGLINSQNFMQIIDFWKSAFKEACAIENMQSTNFKKANLNSMEVGSNDEYTHRQQDKTLTVIQEGLDFVNERFGTNITVEASCEEQELPEAQDEEKEDENAI